MPEITETTELKMTDADRKALERLPDGWFKRDDVSYIVRCPEYRLQRLVDRGKVERKIEGNYPDCCWLYRVKKENNNDH